MDSSWIGGCYHHHRVSAILYYHLSRRSVQQHREAGRGDSGVDPSTVVGLAKASAESVVRGLSDESRVLSDESFRRQLTRTVLELGETLRSLDTSAQSIHHGKAAPMPHVRTIDVSSFHRSAWKYPRLDRLVQDMPWQPYGTEETAKRKALRWHKRKSSEMQGWVDVSMDRITVESPDWLRIGEGLPRLTKAGVG